MIPVSARNIDFVGSCDQGGHGDCVQVMVHKGHAYIGHMFSDGFTVVDVRDPSSPRTVDFVAAPPNSRAFHLQTHGDLLLTVNSPNIWVMQGYSDPNDYFKGSITDTFTKREKTFTAGLRVFDISKPAEPREIGFMPVDGLGLHRLWYVGGRYAYASCHWQGFTDHVLAVIDMQDPTQPEVVGRFWLPGMHAARGETPSWSKGKRYALHHAIVAGNLAYARLARRRVDDPRRRRPDRAQACSATATGARPSAAAPTRRCRCPTATSRSSPTRAISTIAPTASSAAGCSTCATRRTRCRSPPCRPRSEEDYCAKGAKFGPHNLHENRPGSLQSSRS